MKTTKTAKEKLAGLVRVISIPPVMVTALLLILYFWGPQPFCPVGDLVTTILLLGFVPVLAYPAQPLFPRYRSRGREGQRELAFVFTGVGYTIALLAAAGGQAHAQHQRHQHGQYFYKLIHFASSKLAAVRFRRRNIVPYYSGFCRACLPNCQNLYSRFIIFYRI